MWGKVVEFDPTVEMLKSKNIKYKQIKRPWIFILNEIIGIIIKNTSQYLLNAFCEADVILSILSYTKYCFVIDSS